MIELPAYDDRYKDGSAGDELQSSPVANKIRSQAHEALTESEDDLVQETGGDSVFRARNFNGCKSSASNDDNLIIFRNRRGL